MGTFKSLKQGFAIEVNSKSMAWITLIILLVLSVILDLDTKQVDYTCAFLHAPITEDLYVRMPRSFQEEGKVLKLERALYGLCSTVLI